MNGFLYRSALRAAQGAARVAIASMLITVVACGGGSSGDGTRRPMTPADPASPAAPAAPADPADPASPGDPAAPTDPTVPADPVSPADPPPPPPPAPPVTVEGAPPPTVLTLTVRSTKIFGFTWLPSGGATEYRLLEDPVGNTPLVPIATVAGDVFSQDLAVFLPSRMNARYVLQSCNSAGSCSSSNVQTVTAQDLTAAIGYLKPSNTPPDPTTGTLPVTQGNNDVLDLSADGKTLVLGAFLEDGMGAGVQSDQSINLNNRENNSGAVYVFVNTEGVWSQQAYIKALDSRPGLNFGMSVSLSADGNTLAVGAIELTFLVSGGTRTADPRGAVYMFTRSGTTWSQQGNPLRPEITGVNDLFGISVSLADDGNTLAVGAVGEDGNGSGPANNDLTDSGAAYVFTRSGTSWVQQAYLKASNPGAGDGFGGGISLTGDGQTLVVAAGGEDSQRGDPESNNLEDSGAVYVFARSNSGWIPQQLLKADNAQAGDSFGSIALSKDGRTLAVGATQARPGSSSVRSGAVYVFVRDNISANFTQLQPALGASNAENGDGFGGVSLTDDGNTLVVGAIGESSAARGLDGNSADNNALRSGAVYLFKRNGTSWSQQSYIKASNTGAGDLFGFAVVIAGDGSTLGVTAPREASGATGVGGNQDDNSAIAGGGAIYLY